MNLILLFAVFAAALILVAALLALAIWQDLKGASRHLKWRRFADQPMTRSDPRAEAGARLLTRAEFRFGQA